MEILIPIALSYLYYKALRKRAISLNVIFNENDRNRKQFLQWCIRDSQERAFSNGMLVFLGILTWVLTVAFSNIFLVKDPIDTAEEGWLLGISLGVLANFVVVGFALSFMPRYPEYDTIPIDTQGNRSLAISLALTTIASYFMVWTFNIFPFPLDQLVWVAFILWIYWLAFGAAATLFLLPYMLPVGNWIILRFGGREETKKEA